MPTLPSIIPIPRNLHPAEGAFILKSSTIIVVDSLDQHLSRVANAIVDYVHGATGVMLPICAGDERGDSIIRLEIEHGMLNANAEGYQIRVAPGLLRISAARGAGFGHAFQTLRLLLPAEFERSGGAGRLPVEIPALEINDCPRFRWRGLLLDCSRHFMSKGFILRLLDLMALHKLNVLHWHLLDDQGWRLQIDKYPLLTEVGAWRMEDGKKYGGFYSKADVREIVSRATELDIMVVPEIELPGHSSAALAAYPELSCHGRAAEVPTRWGVFKDIMCGGKDAVVQFYKDVLTEVVELFPAPYIHIGGDEAPRDNWKECPLCQQRIRDHGLKDEKQLQTWLTMEIQKFLETKDRRIIGWDELYEGGLPPGAVLQHWRYEECLKGALELGHEVILSRNLFTYFDFPYYKDPTTYSKDTQKMDWMPAIGTEKAYSYPPIPEGLPADKHGLILGGECTMWTEFAPEDRVLTDLFPRLCAFAEVFWSPGERRDYADFSRRLEEHKKRLDALGVNYHTGPESGADWKQIYPPGMEPAPLIPRVAPAR
ncbi:hypothetical protein BH09SUM1_BH09SUM1_20380 [soil metagenome]